MTFSEPSAHSSPLFHDLKLLNFADLHELLMNAITILPLLILLIILPRPHTYTHITPEVLQEVTFSW